MKKSLLTLAGALLTVSTAMGINPGMYVNVPESLQKATRADETVTFGYSGRPETAYKIEGAIENQYIYVVMQITPDDVQTLSGCKITGMSFYTGTGPKYMDPVTDTDVRLFVTDNPYKNPEFYQDEQISSKAFTNNKFKFDEPYVIEAGVPLYVGYRMKLTNLEDFVFVVDQVSTQAPVSLLGGSTDEKMPTGYSNMAPSFGAVCMNIEVEGSNIPHNIVSLTSLSIPEYSQLGQKPVAMMDIYNHSDMIIPDIELKVDVTGESPYTIRLDFDDPLMGTSSSNKTVELRAFATTGEKDVRITLVNINGEPFNTSLVGVNGVTTCVTKSFERRAVVEEGTGNWCTYCPAGIVMMEGIKERFGDKVGRIAVHCGSDPLKIDNYAEWVNQYALAVPVAVLNRYYKQNPSQDIYAFNPDINMLTKNPSLLNPEIGEMTLSDDKKSATFESTVEFAVDTEDSFTVSLAITEDGLGPLPQGNGYAGMGDIAPGNWGNLPSEVEMYYDDVARDLSSYPGELLSEHNIAAGDKIPFTFHMSNMDKVEGDKFRAIMMVSNAKTGEVLNVAIREYSKANGGVSAIEGGNIVVSTGKGSINIQGARNVAIFNLQGVKVADGNASGLAAGLYVVRADDNIRKVMVK